MSVLLCSTSSPKGYPVLIRRWPPRLQVLLVIASSGCAGVRPGQASLSPTSDALVADRPARADRNVITRAEIVPIEMLSAYDVVTTLRRQWLFGRGALTAADGRSEAPRVYVESVLVGSCEALKDIAASAVDELRFLDTREAITRFGTGHTGAILLTLRRR